jgi:hypothetical protein
MSSQNYYNVRALSASLLKKAMKYDCIDFQILEDLHNHEYSNESLDFGTNLHSYILEDGEPVPNYELIKNIFNNFKGEREVEIYKNMFGVPCKSKIDLLQDKLIIDLKTTRDISKIEEHIINYGYDVSMNFYSLMTGINNYAYFWVNKNNNVSFFMQYKKAEWRQKYQIQEFIETNKGVILEWCQPSN